MPGLAHPSRPALRTQVQWTLAGNVLYAAAQWALLIVLTKVLPPASVGQYGLGVAIAAPLLMFTNLQLRSIQATQISEDFGFRDFLGLRLLSTTLGLLFLGGIAVWGGYRADTTRVVLAVGLVKGVESVADAVYGHLQRSEMMSRIAISMILRGFLYLVTLTIALRVSGSLLWAVAAMGSASIGVLVLFDFPSARRAERSLRALESEEQGIRPRWNLPAFRKIAELGLPLGFASLLLALSTNIPRYFIQHRLGEEALGYFSALSYPIAAFSILLSAFGQAATPRMADFYRRDRREFWRTVILLSLVPILTLAVATPALLGVGPRVLAILYRKDYAHYFHVFLVLLAGGALWSLASVLGYAATASRRLLGQVPISLLICGVTCAACWIAIPTYGLMGAGAASVISGGAALVLFGSLFTRRLGLAREAVS